jgi:hypothetical protein
LIERQCPEALYLAAIQLERHTLDAELVVRQGRYQALALRRCIVCLGAASKRNSHLLKLRRPYPLATAAGLVLYDHAIAPETACAGDAMRVQHMNRRGRYDLHFFWQFSAVLQGSDQIV